MSFSDEDILEDIAEATSMGREWFAHDRYTVLNTERAPMKRSQRPALPPAPRPRDPVKRRAYARAWLARLKSDSSRAAQYLAVLDSKKAQWRSVVADPVKLERMRAYKREYRRAAYRRLKGGQVRPWRRAVSA